MASSKTREVVGPPEPPRRLGGGGRRLRAIPLLAACRSGYGDALGSSAGGRVADSRRG